MMRAAGSPPAGASPQTVERRSEMHGLTGVTAGRFAVTTNASEYLIDLDRRVVRRLPVGSDAADLRRDAEEVMLLAVARCEVGRPMTLVIDLNAPGVLATTRSTTFVTAIEKILNPMPNVGAPHG